MLFNIMQSQMICKSRSILSKFADKKAMILHFVHNDYEAGLFNISRIIIEVTVRLSGIWE